MKRINPKEGKRGAMTGEISPVMHDSTAMRIDYVAMPPTDTLS